MVISIHAPRAGSDNGADYERPLTYDISIHAPRAGSDIPQTMGGMSPAIFQSTLPVRGATTSLPQRQGHRGISIHAPRAGSDEYAGSDLDKRMTISIHAPRAGSDSENSDHYPDFQIILVWLFVSGRIWLLILNISQSM